MILFSISEKSSSIEMAKISILGHITSEVSVFPKLTMPFRIFFSSLVVALFEVSARASESEPMLKSEFFLFSLRSKIRDILIIGRLKNAKEEFKNLNDLAK